MGYGKPSERLQKGKELGHRVTRQRRKTRAPTAAGGRACRVQKGKELNDFQRIPLDIEILSNLRFGSLEIRDTSVTRVTNNVSALGCRD